MWTSGVLSGVLLSKANPLNIQSRESAHRRTCYDSILILEVSLLSVIVQSFVVLRCLGFSYDHTVTVVDHYGCPLV